MCELQCKIRRTFLSQKFNFKIEKILKIFGIVFLPLKSGENDRAVSVDSRTISPGRRLNFCSQLLPHVKPCAELSNFLRSGGSGTKT